MIMPATVGEATVVGELCGSPALSREGTEAKPKSSTFTTPSGVAMMFPGLRSRWVMPFSCAASRASAICRA